MGRRRPGPKSEDGDERGTEYQGTGMEGKRGEKSVNDRTKEEGTERPEEDDVMRRWSSSSTTSFPCEREAGTGGAIL